MSSESKEILERLNDLILINGIIASELMTLVENSSKILRNSKEVPPKCIEAHGNLNKQIIAIIEKYNGSDVNHLKSHVKTH